MEAVFTPYSRYKSSERNLVFALLMSLLSTGASLFIPMLTKR
ncbi:Transporter [Bacillus thuringiensis serovar israelensis ATCC 35646]|nr:Transporter [Bacillus thuringiensis serovar israelensis ATCC 35646]